MSKSRTTTKAELLPLVTPGEYLNEELLKPRILGIVKVERAISADTALRLGQYLGVGEQPGRKPV